MSKQGFNTKCIHGYRNEYDNTGAVSVPIYQTATFAHPGVGESTGFDYSRLSNPTREHLEKTVAGLEGGLDAIAFSTGMGATTTLMELFAPEDHIIASEDLYGGSLRYFHTIGMRKGIQFDYVDTGDLEAVRRVIKPTTKAIFVETPTNPMMHVTDIEAVAHIAKEHNALLIIDNTFMTPYLQSPLKLGADIVLHSGTKYLGGHNDTLAGLLVVKSSEILDSLRYISKTIGACLSPFDSWLILRGIKTLPIRMERQQKTALALARWLTDQPWVTKVHYVGLPDHPSYDITCKQSRGFSGMISFVTGNVTIAKKLLGGVKLIQFAESLGGVETLLTYPMTQTHADVPEEERRRKGINDCLLRLSVGLEDLEDLQSDILQAIEA